MLKRISDEELSDIYHWSSYSGFGVKTNESRLRNVAQAQLEADKKEHDREMQKLALNYNTIMETGESLFQLKVREIFEEIDTHSAKEQLPIRDGSHLIRIIPEDAYQAFKEKYLGERNENKD